MELAAALDFARPRTQAVLATLKRDGRPQLSNVGYRLTDDGVFHISVTESRAKTANARRDARVSLYVGTADFGAYVVVEGDAELLPVAAAPDDPTTDALVEYYRAVRGEHPDWDEYREAMVADRRLLLMVRPVRAYGMVPA